MSATELRAAPTTPVRLARLGSVPYRAAWELQHRIVADLQAGHGQETLLLVEHPPVYTLGRRATTEHLLIDAAARDARGIEVVAVDRGGDITYHGPGQLVGYPLLRLAGTRVVDHVRALEAVLIRTVAAFGITATRSPGFSGVWVGDTKLAAIGVRVSAGRVTSHGFALNVAPDLADFAGIVPCGIRDRGVCSLASLDVEVAMDTVMDHLEAAFTEVYGATLVPAGPDLVVPAPSTSKAPS